MDHYARHFIKQTIYKNIEINSTIPQLYNKVEINSIIDKTSKITLDEKK